MRTSLRSLPAALACTGAVVPLCAAQSSAAWPARDCGSIKYTTVETVRHT